MTSSNIVKAKKTSLNGKLTSTQLSFTLKQLVSGDSAETALTMTHFGDWFVAVFKSGSSQEMIKCTGITQNADGTATITVDPAGRNILAIPPYTGSASGSTFNSGTEVIVSNDPLTLAQFARTGNANTWEGVQTFNAVPKSNGTATDPTELPTLSQVQALATGNSITDRVLLSGTAGEGVSAGQIVYFKEGDGKWYLSDATDLAKCGTSVIKGIATETKLVNETVIIEKLGQYSAFTGLTVGVYYLSDTAGGISTTAGTNEVVLGVALSATNFWFQPHFNSVPSADQLDAMAGMSGKTPNANNKFVDESAVSNGSTYTASTIAFVDSDPDTITDSANGFVTAGFKEGQAITISGSASNDGTYTIKSVVAGTITLIATDSLVAEVAGASVTISADKANKVAMFDPNGELPMELAQTLTAYEGLTAGDLVKHINDSGTAKMRKLTGEYPDYTQTPTQNAELGGIGWNPSTESIRAKALSDTLVIVSYHDTSGSNYPYVIALQIASDGTITTGSSYQANNTNTNNITSLAKLTSTKFVIGYWSSSTVYYKVGTVSGTSISFGASTASASINNTVATELDSTTFISGGYGSGGSFDVQVGTVSGTTITFGATRQIIASGLSSAKRDIDLTMLTSTKLVASWKVSSTIYSAVADVTGTSIGAFGSSVSVSITSGGNSLAVERLTDTSFIWAYINSSNYVRARVCTVSGLTVTLETEQVINGGNCTYPTIAPINGSSFIIGYYDLGYTKLNVIELQSDGVTMNVGSVVSITPSNNSYGGETLCTLSNTRTLICYDNSANPIYAETTDYTAKDDRGDIVGVVEETIATDATGKVAVARGDKASGQSLTAGAMYYIQGDGTMGTTETAYKVGIALSTTELLLLI